MTNQQLIKSAHIWAVALVLFGAIAFAGNAGSRPAHLAQQNSNSNQNQNSNANQNTNTNTSTRNANNTNAAGDTAGASAMTPRDQKFVTETAMAGLMEVELGRWAAQKGTSPEVKQFGQRMVEDHSKAITELTQLATSKSITLPTQLDEKHQRNVSKISRLTGAEFDKAYSKMMLKDHENAVKNFEKQSTSGDDADLKAFAGKTLPTVQEHLQMARALPGNTKATDSNVNSNVNRNSNSNNSNSP